MTISEYALLSKKVDGLRLSASYVLLLVKKVRPFLIFYGCLQPALFYRDQLTVSFLLKIITTMANLERARSLIFSAKYKRVLLCFLVSIDGR